MQNEIVLPWYQELVDDCKTIITETIFASRWTLVKGYHRLGIRILNDEPKMKQGGTTLGKTLQHVAKYLKTSERTLYYATQFAKKYPNLSLLPEGKTVTWHKICNKYLPKKKESILLPEGKYGVILSDPPWPYPERLDIKNTYGNAASHYPTMAVEEICALPVKTLAVDNSVLFLWVATYFLKDAFQVIESWGFEYKSNMVWVKEGGHGGIGWYVWGDHELLLIATKGSYLPKTKKLASSVVKAPREKHSKKPDKFYEIIEYLYPDDKYIELFARRKRKGWNAWGNEIKKDGNR